MIVHLSYRLTVLELNHFQMNSRQLMESQHIKILVRFMDLLMLQLLMDLGVQACLEILMDF